MADEIPLPLNHVVEAIDAATVKPRKGAGDNRGIAMSQAVAECDRQIWYDLRWAALPETVTGQKQRIFDTGHIYERRLLDWLRAAGADVVEVDEATGGQFRVELADGWVRGKLDGKATGVPGAPVVEHVVECKSHKLKSFKALKAAEATGEGLRKAKPDHFAQVQLYMHATGIHRGLYLAVCKDSDEVFAERIHYDPTFAIQIEERARRIARADHMPAAHDGHWCSWCKAAPQCKAGHWGRINCRTCIYASFIDGAEVVCTNERSEHNGTALTYDQQQAGCNGHRYLPDLVPGEQIDVIEPDFIVYRLDDGSEWTDGPADGAAQ